MDKRSYLDSLNAGRVRRPQPTLEQLNRSLEHLEKQLDIRAAQKPDTYQSNRRRLADETAYYGAAHESRLASPRQPTAARADEHARVDSRGHRDQARIADELEALRREMRTHLEMSREEQSRRDAIEPQATRVAQELEAMRQEMRDQLVATRRDLAQREQAPGLGDAYVGEISEIRGEIERLTDTIQLLNQRSDERPLNVLRLELEQARAAIESLAREDTVRSIGLRWDDFERRIAAFEDRMAAELRARPQEQSVDALHDRLDQVYAALNSLPDSLPLRSLDDKMRKLSGAVEQFVQHQDARQPQSLNAIETRLDEISRAIVASAVSSASGGADAEQMKRIEARISTLSRQIEDSAQGSSFHETFDRLDSISRRVDTIADRLDHPQPAPVVSDMGLLDAMEARFSDIAERLDTTRASNEAIMGMEERLASIAARLDRPTPAAPAVDPTLVSKLEAQIAGLSQFLSRPDPNREELSALSPRLERLEQSIVGSRDVVVAAAREAAERAVHALSDVPRGDLEAANGLADDLRQLESLARRSDERNTKTFEAIHDTLLKIVDRLGTLEHRGAGDEIAQPRRKFDLPQTPSMDLSNDLTEQPAEQAPVTKVRPQWTPAQAAAAAAEAALDDSVVASEPTSGRRTLGDGLGRNENVDVPPLAGMNIAEPEIPTVDLDEPLDPSAANLPLEPGSGAPDLNAIMRRVRDNRSEAGKQADAEAAKTDFIAAARRAAQAAAAEADAIKRDAAAPQKAGKGGSWAEMLKVRRKPILMAAAAVMIALAGLQLGKSFLNDPSELADGGPETSAAEVDNADVAQAPAEELSSVRQAQQNEAGEPSVEIAAGEAAPADMAGGEVMDNLEAMAPAGEGPIMPIATPAPTNTTAAPAAEAVDAAAAKIEVPADAGPIPLRDAAAAGDSKALFEIGARYAEGRGVKADMGEAAKWYEKSAELGFAPAQYRIGNLFEKGNGVTRDIAKAQTWYQLAANQGNASAMHNLAVLFAMGASGATDNDSAARWFTQAADLGVKDSQFNLGILAAKGVGMPANLEESYKWFALVAKAGDKDAATKRDEIAKSLRPEQLERARASVELWKPKTPNAETNNAEIPESWQESPATTAGVDMKKAIRNVQAILNKNGYDAGQPDGVIGQRTTDAIKAFQKDNGLDPTGNVDKPLVEALLAKK
ncbi:MAG: peptidoglycan-binding protein [Rhizobiaceae bacterium]